MPTVKDTRYRGWHWDGDNNRIDVYVSTTECAYFQTATAGSYLTVANGIAVSTGGLTVTAGGVTVTAGGVSLVAGDLTMTSGQAIQTGTSDNDNFVIQAYDTSTAYVQVFKVQATTGSSVEMGFYGKLAAQQATIATVATTTQGVTLNLIIAALENIGLLAT